MAPTTTPVRPSTTPSAAQPLTAPTGTAARAMTRAERDRLTSDLRMACMRISRRVRFESTTSLAPHQFSVLARLEEQPHTPNQLAAIEKVSAPSMSRTVAGLVEVGLVARADDPTDGRQVILSLTARAGARCATSAAGATSGSRPGSRSSPTTSGRCWRRPRPCWNGWRPSEPHLLLAAGPQLPALGGRCPGVEHRHLDGPGRPGLARAHRAHRRVGDGARCRHRAAVPPLPPARPLGRADRRPVRQAPHPAAHPEPARGHEPAARRPGRHRRGAALAGLRDRAVPGHHDRSRQPGTAGLRLRDGARRAARPTPSR